LISTVYRKAVTWARGRYGVNEDGDRLRLEASEMCICVDSKYVAKDHTGGFLRQFPLFLSRNLII